MGWAGSVAAAAVGAPAVATVVAEKAGAASVVVATVTVSSEVEATAGADAVAVATERGPTAEEATERLGGVRSPLQAYSVNTVSP